MFQDRRWALPSLVGLICCTAAWGTDIDSDGIEDSIDVCCDTPEGAPVDAVGRPLGDIDGDCDVDLADFELLQQSFTGPSAGGCWTDADCGDGDACTINLCNVASGECVSHDVPNCATCAVPPGCGIEITCDDSLDGEINPFTETDKYCFCVAENENLSIFVVERGATTFAPAWRVLDAGGNSVGPCGGTLSTTALRDCGPLPAAGNPYTIEVEDQGRNEIGLYSVHLQRYDPSASCGTTPLPPCEASLIGTIEKINDADLFSFNATAGQTVRITAFKDPLAGANFTSAWRLLDGAGLPVAPCDAFSATLLRDCGPLSAALNPYRIEVADNGLNDTGSFTLHVLQLTSSEACGVTDLACDTHVSALLETQIASDLYNFAAGNNEIVRISVLKGTPAGVNFAPAWRLLDNTGFGFGVCAAFATGVKDCGPLPSSRSPYRLETVDSGVNDSGAYDAHIQRLTQFRECDIVDLECATPANAATSTFMDTDLFRLVSPEDEVVRVNVLEQPGGGANYAPNWRLLNAAGVPTSNCSAFAISTSRDCGPLAASGNPYRIEVEDQGRNDIGTYQVTVDFITSGCPE